MGKGDGENKNNGGGNAGKKNDGGDGGKNNNGGDGGKKKEDQSPINVVLKVHMHCDGCATKIIKCIRSFDDVESVKAEWEKSKVTVVGKVDPAKLRDKLAKQTKKAIELVSPLPKKEKEGGGEKKSEPKTEQKTKEPPVTTAVLKINLHCNGCFEKIRRIASKFKGVHAATLDREKDLVTVKGTMDEKALQACLKEKMKRSVDIVPPKKDGGSGQKQKGGGDGGQKEENGGKKEEKGGGDGGGKDAVYKLDHYGYGYILGPGYFVEPVHPPQLFSDENPNACAIM